MNATELEVQRLLTHAKKRHPDRRWKIVADDTVALRLGTTPGTQSHPSPTALPRAVRQFAGCTVEGFNTDQNLVLAVAVDEHDLTLDLASVPTYELNLTTGRIK